MRIYRQLRLSLVGALLLVLLAALLQARVDAVFGVVSGSGQDTFTPEADLAITKDDRVTVALPGDAVSYTITVTNTGPIAVKDATVEDLFPPELIGCRWTCAPDRGAVCTTGPVSGDLEDFLDLEVSTSVIYTATCTVDPAAIFAVLSNTATITAPADVTDPDLGNNTATDRDAGPLSLIFVDGFESGDTSAWSMSVP